MKVDRIFVFGGLVIVFTAAVFNVQTIALIGLAWMILGCWFTLNTK